MIRIYTKCPACHNDTLTVNDDKHLLCTWISCPDPTLISRIDEEFNKKQTVIKTTSVTMKRSEIFDLAKTVSLLPWQARLEDHNLSDEEHDTEYTIVTKEGGVEIEDDDGTKRKYPAGAYYTEYPDEGTFPIGEEIK